MHNHGINPCVFCGKEIENEPNFYVEINAATGTVWSAFAMANGKFVNCPTSQGMFPVGNECAKNFYTNVLHDKYSTPALWKVGA